MIIDLSTSHHLPKQEGLRCPGCNNQADGATGQEHSPVAGDLSVCAFCGVVLKYSGTEEQLSIDKLTSEEYVVLPQETKWKIALFQSSLKSIRNKSN